MRRAFALAVGVVALFLAGAPGSGAQTGAPSEQDMTFMKGQQESNLAEISLGKVVMERATSPAVRTLAAKLVEDHTAVMEQNKALSAKLGIVLPEAPNAKQQAMAEHVKSLTGVAFDREYADGQVEAHTTSVASAEKEIASGSHPEVKAFATDYLPKAQEHLRMAQAVQTELAAEGQTATLPRTGSATGVLAVTGLGLAVLGVLARLEGRRPVARR